MLLAEAFAVVTSVGGWPGLELAFGCEVDDGAALEGGEFLFQAWLGQFKFAGAEQAVAKGIGPVVADEGYFAGFDGETVSGAPGHRLAGIEIVPPAGDFVGAGRHLIHEVLAEGVAAADVLVVAHGCELDSSGRLALALDLDLQAVGLGEEEFSNGADDDCLAGIERLGVVVLAGGAACQQKRKQGEGEGLHGLGP